MDVRDQPGHAQADFGEALVVIAGQEQKAHYFCLDLPQSDDLLCDGISGRNDGSFSGRTCPSMCLLGRRATNDPVRQHEAGMAQILGDGTRRRTQTFSELQSHYLFAERFGRPGKGNDKDHASYCTASARFEGTSSARFFLSPQAPFLGRLGPGNS
jgi:hypothetical protein